MKCILVALMALALLSPGSTAPEEDVQKPTCGFNMQNSTTEKEVLLYTRVANATYQEIKSIGGRVTLQFGRNLVVAKVPPNAPLNLKTASLSMPTTASNDALNTYVRAYKAAVEDLNGPPPVIRRWNEMSAPKVFPSIQELEGAAPATYSPTMSGKIVIILLLPTGPDKVISDGQRDKALSEVVTGLKFWADNAPSSASLSFVTYYGRITISKGGDSDCCDSGSYSACHNIFADATYKALGYSTGSSGRNQILTDYTDYENADGGVIAFISHYKLCHFAYAYFGGGPLYMDYDNDGWGSSDIDRVFAHEIGHTFNAPDEYTSCNCNTNYGKGSCTAKNDNCKDGTDCTSNQAKCIMDSNNFQLCNYTPKHVGWC